jgi:hypothetical protein
MRRLAAQEATPRDSAPHGWYAGIASGWYFPTQRWNSPYTVGGGGTLLLGRETGRHWAVQIEANMWLLSGSAQDTWDLKAGPVVTWTAGSVLAPFAFAGLGVDVQTSYPARSSTVGPMVPVGAGLRFAIGPDRAVFMQSAYYVVFRSVATRDIALLGGFKVGL